MVVLAAPENKRKTENEKYRDEHYPNLYPCKNCAWWKGSGSSWGASLSLPMCHYMLNTGELRGCEPDYINQTCERFQERTRKCCSR